MSINSLKPTHWLSELITSRFYDFIFVAVCLFSFVFCCCCCFCCCGLSWLLFYWFCRKGKRSIFFLSFLCTGCAGESASVCAGTPVLAVFYIVNVFVYICSHIRRKWLLLRIIYSFEICFISFGFPWSLFSARRVSMEVWLKFRRLSPRTHTHRYIRIYTYLAYFILFFFFVFLLARFISYISHESFLYLLRLLVLLLFRFESFCRYIVLLGASLNNFQKW